MAGGILIGRVENRSVEEIGHGDGDVRNAAVNG
jgi:hypothetical protein